MELWDARFLIFSSKNISNVQYFTWKKAPSLIRATGNNDICLLLRQSIFSAINFFSELFISEKYRFFLSVSLYFQLPPGTDFPEEKRSGRSELKSNWGLDPMGRVGSSSGDLSWNPDVIMCAAPIHFPSHYVCQIACASILVPASPSCRMTSRSQGHCIGPPTCLIRARIVLFSS